VVDGSHAVPSSVRRTASALGLYGVVRQTDGRTKAQKKKEKHARCWPE
jgi:hypothetical protein